MKKLLLALALLLPPSQVLAKTILVSSGGSSSVPADSGAAMPGVRMSVANAIAIPGDKIVIMDDGNAPIAPVNSGTQAAFIAYVGKDFAGNVRPTGGTVMPIVPGSFSLDTLRMYITVKGLQFNEAALGNHDSIAFCKIVQRPAPSFDAFSIGGDNSVAVGNYMNVRDWFTDCYSGDCINYGYTRTVADTVRNNYIAANPGTAYSYSLFWRGMTRFVVDSNEVHSTVDANVDAASHHNEMNWCQENKFIGNNFYFYNLNSSARYAFQIRDSTARNIWTGNNITMMGPHNSRIGMHNSGNAANYFVGANRWDGNTIKNPYGDGFWYGGNMARDTLINNVVATYGPSALIAPYLVGPIVIRHNTFWTWRTSGDQSTSYGVITFAGSGGAWSDSLYFTSNIVATHTPLANLPPQAGDVHFWTSISGLTPCRFKANYNLYYYPFYKDSVGDRSIYLYSAGGAGDRFARPGYGKKFWILTGANGNARDSASVHGDPLFADTNSVQSFNPSLLSGSPAIAATFPDGYAGAVYTDGIRPAAVSDLAVAIEGGQQAINNTSVRVSWTDTGDDSLTYTATRFDIRVSLSTITEAGFDTCGAVPANLLPNPASPGTGHELIIPGLGASQTYYVAMKVIDDRGNQSAISNVISFTTKANNAGGNGDPHYLPPDDEISP